MRYHRKLKNALYIVTAIFIITTIIFTALQLKYQTSIACSIINNISICILTGCVIALIQAVIGYKTAKHDSLLVFYKDAIMLEDKIIHYPYMNNGFIDSVSGLKEVREILNLYSSTLKLSYFQIDMSGKQDGVLKAAEELFNTYSNEIAKYKKFEDALCESIRFMDKTDEELINEGVSNIKLATDMVNKNLQHHATVVMDTYNDASIRKKRNSAFEILEDYLFKKKVDKQ